MNNRKAISYFVLAIPCLLFIVVSCSSPIDSPVIPTTTQVQVSASPSLSTLPLQTHTPTISRPLQSPTWTPLSTLSPEDAQDFVEDLLATNAGCKLPCWWGLTPGVTTWQTTERFLNTFATVNTRGDVPQQFMADVFILTLKELEIYPMQSYRFQDGILETIKIDDPGRSSAFNFLEFLNTYGPPSEVWIRTYSEGVREVSPPFEVALFYPDQGIASVFGVEGVVGEDYVRGCPQQGIIPFFGLRSPELEITFNEAADMFRWDPQEFPFRSLNEAAGMEVDSFYSIFSDPLNDTCLETPIDLWTPQY